MASRGSLTWIDDDEPDYSTPHLEDLDESPCVSSQVYANPTGLSFFPSETWNARKL